MSTHFRRSSLLPALTRASLLVVLVLTAVSPAGTRVALASHTPNPTSVTIAGSLQSELGCSGDWDPGCAGTHLTYDAGDDVWQGMFNVPAGNWEYKAALNDSWGENYGLHAGPGGANIPLNLVTGTSVKFYYDHKSHWITDNQTSVIAVAPGSFQSELGCPGDWDPGCLRSWLQDPDGDGVYTFETTALPAGSYEAKVALNESWDVNYGQGGVQNGANIPFVVAVNNAKVTFSYNSTTHVLTVLTGHAHDGNVEWDGLRHDSRDTLYRTPGGAVPANTPVTLRFRTFHDDVTGVKARVYDLNLAAQRILPLSLAASDVSCYQANLRLLGRDPARDQPEQPVVPLHRHRRQQDRLLCRQHVGPRRRPGQHQRQCRRQQLGTDVLRSHLYRPGLGQQRRHLPDLPRPLPQRPQQQ